MGAITELLRLDHLIIFQNGKYYLVSLNFLSSSLWTLSSDLSPQGSVDSRAKI